MGNAQQTGSPIPPVAHLFVALQLMSNKFPSALLRSLIQEHGIEDQAFIDTHERGAQVTSVRLNPEKRTTKFDQAELVPWCADGRYLAERPSFIADPLFHAGCYYVQEASSMFLEQILKHTCDLESNLRVLDLCAAPGGKSTLIASLINDQSLLVSNEIIKSRVPVLSDNLTKWGTSNCVVTNNDPRDFNRLDGYFDVMVVDAPCSGSGMFRKDPMAINEWSENNVQLCSERQQRILANACPALAQGGVLIYSTCSYSKKENEDIADWLCDTYGLKTIRIPLDASWGIEETESDKHRCFGYRFYPHQVKGEGFFITCFQKTEGDVKHAESSKVLRVNASDESILKRWIHGPDHTIHPAKDGYCFIAPQFLADVRHLQSRLYVKKSGVYAGKIVGKDLVPDQELAQSLLLSPNIQRAELDEEQALMYLRKDTLELDGLPTGWTLMCYQDFGLGWAKVLPNRINNYYPREMRILKEF